MQSGRTESSLLESIPTLERSLMQMRVGLTPTSRVPTVAADMVTTTSFRRHILVKPVDTLRIHSGASGTPFRPIKNNLT